MSNKPLVTYLRMFRRRTGLSQDDVGFLLGSIAGDSVSRHEQGSRIPTLRIALGYAHILNAHMPELYEGLLAEIGELVHERANGLCKSLARKPRTPQRDRKIASLQRLLGDGLTTRQ